MIKREDVYKIGRLGKAHGVKGEVSFQFDDDIFDTTDADYLILEIDGILVPFFMEEYRFRSDALALVKFCDIDTLQRASELTGCDVYFPRSIADEDTEGPSEDGMLIPASDDLIENIDTDQQTIIMHIPEGLLSLR